MNNNYKIKKITKLYENCNRCGLPIINCICNDIRELKTEAKIWIISSKKELTRASNTARILKLSNKYSTEIFIWERTKEPRKLIEKIESKKYDVYLLFPITEETKFRKTMFTKGSKIPAFIIIDGTWQEAKKIFRKSSYLSNIKVLSLEPERNSNFLLRRGIEEGNLCTIETAIEVLKLNNENKNAIEIERIFELFQKSYKSGLSGHKIKN